MDVAGVEILDLLARHGPWLLLLLAFLETSFVTGLVVPAGVATSAATVLAAEGVLPLSSVVLSATAGAWLGDTTGYWVGRLGGERLERGEGRLARLLHRSERRASRFFGRHPALSVTVARWVAFVRTVMPMAAGMGRVGYGRFLLWEAPGVVGWTLMYVSVGLLARESWRVVSSAVGVGWAVVFAVAAAVLWWRGRARVGRVVEVAAGGEGEGC